MVAVVSPSFCRRYVAYARISRHNEIDNVDNSERFSTYVILAEAGSGTISMNSTVARKVQVGDRVIIAAYGQFSEQEAENCLPKLVYLTGDNAIERTANTIPIQVA